MKMKGSIETVWSSLIRRLRLNQQDQRPGTRSRVNRLTGWRSGAQILGRIQVGTRTLEDRNAPFLKPIKGSFFRIFQPFFFFLFFFYNVFSLEREALPSLYTLMTEVSMRYRAPSSLQRGFRFCLGFFESLCSSFFFYLLGFAKIFLQKSRSKVSFFVRNLLFLLSLSLLEPV